MDRINKIVAKIQKDPGSTSQNSSTTDKYECDTCKDISFIISRETNTAIPCKCRGKKLYREILQKSDISDVFIEKTFDNFYTKGRPDAIIKAENMAIEYARNFNSVKNTRNNSIAFLGQVGSGKTHLSIAIANELMKQDTGVLYMQYREKILKLKQNVLDEIYYQREVNKYKSAPVLLIDDLYKGKVTDADYNIMFEIVNFRYLKALPVIVSSEYTHDEILDKDEAIGSRIVEMCKGRIIEFEGQELNYRLWSDA